MDLRRQLARVVLTLILSLLALAGMFWLVLADAPLEETGPAWPGWLGARRDGVTSEPLRLDGGGLRELWRREVGAGCASVAIDRGRLYTSGNRGNVDTLYCLNAASGRVLWRYDYPCKLAPNSFEGGPCATPALHGGLVFTLSRQGDLLCLNALTGQRVWARQAVGELGAKRPTWGFSGSPLILGEWVIFCAGRVVALEQTTGRTVWQTRDLQAVYSSPLAVMGEGGRTLLAVNSEAAGLVLLDAEGGREVTAYPRDWPVHVSTPLVQGGQLFAWAAEGHAGVALRLTAGARLEPLWESKALQSWVSTAIPWRGVVFGFHENDLACMDWATGRELWRQKGLGEGSLARAGDRLVIQSGRGELIVAEASGEGYRELARRKIFDGRAWAAPVVCGGRIYLRSNRGELACLQAARAMNP